MSFDVANQSFTLLINTLLFSVFFTNVVLTGSTWQSSLWSIMTASSMVLVVLASPIVGAMGDAMAWKKRFLVGSGLVCALLTCLFGLIQPGQLWLAVLLYVPANFCFNLGENFLASFLPQVATRESLARVSGFSWACAYGAAFLLLVLTAGGMLLFKLQSPDSWRPFFVLAGVWFLVFTIPTMRTLREGSTPQGASGHAWKSGFARLGQTLRNARTFRDLALLLVASFFYGVGMNVIIFFASILAAEYGFNDIKLVIFVGVITLSGILGTLVPTFFQDRLGHRRCTLLLLCVWVLAACGFAYYAWRHDAAPRDHPVALWPMWLIGNVLGFGLGSLGAANRAFVGALTPRERSAEFFGVWGMVFKLASIGTIPFAVVKDKAGTPASLLVLAGFVVVGLVLTLLVNERRGLETVKVTENIPNVSV